MKHILLTCVVLTVLAGCDSSSDDDSGINIPVAKTISGSVIDGYLTGATVFLDLNGNGILDEIEPSAITTGSGDYALDLSAEEYDCQPYVPLVVDVPVGAVDSDTGAVEDAYQLVFPPLVESAFDNTDITPLTTVLWELFKEQFLITDDELDSPTLACDTIRNNQEKVDEFKELIDQTISDIVRHIQY